MSNELKLITPDDLVAVGDKDAFPLHSYELKFLAQGDSWFSIGALPPNATTNLLESINLNKKAVAVNCAVPGAELRHMINTTTSFAFLTLLRGRLSHKWDGILLSGVGNDIISACGSAPAAPRKNRIFLTKSEWGSPAVGPSRYISEEGWKTFEKHIIARVEIFLSERDSYGGLNRDVPVFLHTYDYATPRAAPAGFGFGPWLKPACDSYEIPDDESERTLLCTTLFDRVASLIEAISHPSKRNNVIVVKTQGTLKRASISDVGSTEHWQNEIHPTKSGYKKLGGIWSHVINDYYK